MATIKSDRSGSVGKGGSSVPSTRSPATRRRGTQARGREARRKILEAAEHLFAESGYSATRLEAIARRAQMSKQRMHHYYPSKRALYGAVVADIHQFLEDTAPEAGDVEPAAANLAGLSNVIDQLAARPTIAGLFLFEMATPTTPREFAPFARRSIEDFEEIFRKIAPNAPWDDAIHFSSTIAGTLFFYSTALHMRAAGRPGPSQGSVERHKELLLSTALHLITKIQRDSQG